MFMIEGQFGHLVDGEPAGFGCVVGALHPGVFQGGEAVEGDADGACPGVAVDGAEGRELLQFDAGEPRFLLQLPDHGLFQGLFHVDKASGEGPLTLIRRIFATDQQRLPPAFPFPEDDGVDGDAGAGVVVAVVQGSKFKACPEAAEGGRGICSRFKVQSSRFKVQGSKFKVQS